MDLVLCLCYWFLIGNIVILNFWYIRIYINFESNLFVVVRNVVVVGLFIVILWSRGIDGDGW